jgi:hypothetical protein
VPSLTRSTRARRAKVWVHRSDPHWQEAFLHPKQAQGIVVQMVDAPPTAGWPAKARDDAARVRGVRLSSRSVDAARRQWGELLGGAGGTSGDSLLFRYPESPLVVLVEIDTDRDEGPLAIELQAARDLKLPGAPHPELGTRFVQVPA